MWRSRYCQWSRNANRGDGQSNARESLERKYYVAFSFFVYLYRLPSLHPGICTNVVGVKPIQLLVYLLSEFLCRSGRKKAGHYGSRDDQVRAPIYSFPSVSTWCWPCPCSPHFSHNLSSPDGCIAW